MPKKILYLLIWVCGLSFSQTVTVNDSSHSATDLANLLLDGSCIDPTNVSSSSSQSVAYFNNNGGTFPLTEGIILRSGIAANTAGMYTNTNLSSSINTNSDPDLDAIADAISGQNATITDTAFLQFDFTPISSNFNFNFIFASNEYGQWQCGFSDVFAFLITDLNTGVTTNLAVIPGTTTPIAVTTVRDNAYNNGCTSENPGLFDTYNVNNPASSTINMRGYTTTLNATSTLTPNNPYRIKLAIGDFNNQDFDSAVFIDSGSFNTEIDLGPDTSLCLGDSFDVTTGLDETEYNHSWTLNGNPIGINSNTLTIDQIGTYDVIATQNGTSCQIPGQIIISDLTYTQPNNLTNCDTGATQYSYDLTQNNITTLGLDPAIYEIEYYDSASSFPGSPIPNNDLTNYINDGNPQPIIIKILNTITGNYCDVDIIFMLELSSSPVANQPNNIDLCENGGTTTVDLTQQNAQVLGALPPANYNVLYFSSQTDAQNNLNSIGNTTNVTSADSPVTVWVRVENINNPDCFDITSFEIIVHPLPNVPELPDVTECSQYTLPPLSDGTYYDASGGPTGGGNQLNPGDILDTGGTYYVFVGPDVNGCTNESDFIVTLVDEYNIPINYCQSDMFTIPSALDGVDSNFYTEAGGPNGTGILLPEGTPVILDTNGDLEYQGLGITVSGNSDIIYYYAEINGVFCIEIPFPISIFIDPPVDQPNDVTTCLNYTLPALVNGNYVGHNVGDLITSTEIISISNTIDNATTDLAGNPITHSCTSTSSFTVTIINEPGILPPQCDSYTLPNLTVGEYYLQANGQGVLIPQGTVIELDGNGDLVYVGLGITITGNTDNIYVFASDTVNATNCTNNMFFELTINPTPPVDSSSNNQIIECVTDGYILPNLTHGDYYSEPGGQGTLIPDLTDISIDSNGDLVYGNGLGVLHPGIGSINTVYIYNEVNNCSNESTFTVEIRDLPIVDSFADVYQCDPYILEATTNGEYYTEPGGPYGTGTVVAVGTEISSITTLYIFNEWNDLAGCTNETTFTINILGVDVGTIADVNECDSYSLPPLNVGNYYSQQQTYPPNSADEIPVGTTYTENQPAPNPIYVYAFNEDRIVCESQTSFTVTVSDTPDISTTQNLPTSPVEICGSYDLPILDNSNYNIAYYLQPNGVSPVNSNTLTVTDDAPETFTIYAYATAFNNVNCFDEESFTVTIYPLREIEIEGGIICVDPITNETLSTVLLETGLNPIEYSVDWYLNNNLVHNGVSFNADAAGTYTVEFTKLTADIPPICNYNSTTVEVFQSSVAVVDNNSVIVSEYFADSNSITINILGGYGQYIYSLDGGTPQESNVFHDVPSGDHIITITDTYGNCGSVILEATVINYPKFFSPNGDQINDTWNIWDLRNLQPNAEIIIFNRFGKFITNFNANSSGWDGTYNGEKLFSDDYWFIVKYQNQAGDDKEFRAHFSLKR